jgi:hypothetical protein
MVGHVSADTSELRARCLRQRALPDTANLAESEFGPASGYCGLAQFRRTGKVDADELGALDLGKRVDAATFVRRLNELLMTLVGTGNG